MVKPPSAARLASVSTERVSRNSRDRSRSPCRIEDLEAEVDPLTHQAVKDALDILSPEHQEHVLAIVRAEPEKFPTVETIIILTQQMMAQVTKIPEDLKIEPIGRGPLQPFWNSREISKSGLHRSGKGRAKALPAEVSSSAKGDTHSPLNAMTI